jgi:cobalt/nickel transport system permease protein
MTTDVPVQSSSPIQAWDPRYRLIGLLGLIFACAAIRNSYLIPVLPVIGGTVWALSGLPPALLLARLRYPGTILLAAALFTAFGTGQTVVFAIGPFSLHREGLLAALLIVSRFVSIITMAVALFESAPFSVSLRAMQALGLPALLVDMALLTYRYIFEFDHTLHTMRTAMRLRGFRADRLNRHTLRMLAALAGNLLIRGFDQSERVYHAMILRGYGRPGLGQTGFHAGVRDRLGLGICLLGAIALVGLDLGLQ